MTASLPSEYITHLNLVGELYPASLSEQYQEDKVCIIRWLRDVLIFATENQTSRPDHKYCDFILQITTYRKLLEIIANRFYIAANPADAVNLFDYGEERKYRESVLVNITNLADIIVSFYNVNVDLLIAQHRTDCAEIVPFENSGFTVNQLRDNAVSENAATPFVPSDKTQHYSRVDNESEDADIEPTKYTQQTNGVYLLEQDLERDIYEAFEEFEELY